MPVAYPHTISNGKLGHQESPFANTQIRMNSNCTCVLLYGPQAGIGSKNTSFVSVPNSSNSQYP